MPCHASTLPATTSQRVDRRVLLKASAAVGAMAALGSTIPRIGRAQDGGGTRAATWVEAAAIGAFEAASEPIFFPTDFTFYAAAPHWSGLAGVGGLVEMSFSADGQSWTDPTVVGAATADAGQPDRDGRTFGHLQFTDGANYIRYRSLDAAGNPAGLPELAFTYIDATGGPSINDVFSAATDPSVERPPIISRSMWGADESYRHEDQDPSQPIQWPPGYQTVEHVIIHHTATSNFQDPLTAIRSIYYYHAVTRGWSDIGYNYLVDYMGNVYEGRYGGENVIGGHSYQYAQGSSGISVIGNYSNVEETPEAQAGLIWISAWVARHLDPLGFADFHQTSDLPTICSHRDVNDTDCPGDALYSNLEWIRTSVANVLAGAIDPEPNPTFSDGDVVSVSVDAANIRSGPGLDFDVVAVAWFGTSLQVIDGPSTNDGYTWYRVTGQVGTGWCAEELLTLTNNAPPAPPPAQFMVGDRVVIDTDALNLREGPGLNNSIVVVAPNGTVGDVVDGPSTADGYNWFRLETSIGTGWGAGAYLALSDSPGSGPFNINDEVVVDTDALNLRAGPGTSSNVVAVMLTGARLTITDGPAESDGYVWYEVSSSTYGTGWCAAEFLAATDGSPGGGGRFSSGDVVVVDTDALNLRSGPGTDRDVVAVMPTGTQLTITDGPSTGSGYVWYQVTSDAYGSGWCADEFLALSSAASNGFADGEMAFVDTDVLNLRSEPSLSAGVTASMPTGTRLRITGNPSTADGYTWYPVDSDTYGSGWSAGEYMSLVSSDASNGIAIGSTVRVIDGDLNLRSGPGTDSNVLTVLPDGAQLRVIGGPAGGASYTWYELSSSTYGEGWSAAAFLEPV